MLLALDGDGQWSFENKKLFLINEEDKKEIPSLEYLGWDLAEKEISRINDHFSAELNLSSFFEEKKILIMTLIDDKGVILKLFRGEEYQIYSHEKNGEESLLVYSTKNKEEAMDYYRDELSGFQTLTLANEMWDFEKMTFITDNIPSIYLEKKETIWELYVAKDLKEIFTSPKEGIDRMFFLIEEILI